MRISGIGKILGSPCAAKLILARFHMLSWDFFLRAVKRNLEKTLIRPIGNIVMVHAKEQGKKCEGVHGGGDSERIPESG